MTLAWEIALRYLRRRSSRLVSKISLLAIGGVALGVMALVIAMGLMAGYRQEITTKLVGANAQVVIFPLSPGGLMHPQALEKRLAEYPRVRAMAAVIYGQGMAYSPEDPEGTTIVVKGIDPEKEKAVAAVDRMLGDAARAFAPDSRGVDGCAIGFDLARRLELHPGDTVDLALPDASRRGVAFGLRRRPFRVSKIFRTNFYEYDSEWIFMSRAAARGLSGLPAPANVLEIRLDTPARTPRAVEKIRDLAGDEYSVSDWRSLNGNLFSALTIQKVSLFLLIGLIVAVSTFNIVATLVMSVQERKRDIGILSAMGAPARLPVKIFLRLGLLLGASGVALGLVAGSIVCVGVTRLRLISFPPAIAQIYFVSYVPFVVRGKDLLVIALFSLGVIALASWVPARRAARLDVIEALRYE